MLKRLAMQVRQEAFLCLYVACVLALPRQYTAVEDCRLHACHGGGGPIQRGTYD